MLSILIPTYNCLVHSLVNELSLQLERLNLGSAEIIIGEDGSENTFVKQNSVLTNLPFVKHYLNEENVGRSIIRNKLAEIANNDLLLFIDADSEIGDKGFLNNYISCEGDVFVGGTDYREKNVAESQKTLRYYYGVKREQFDESNFLSKGFAANNFMIKKSVFMDVKFDESIVSYGHEDTLFGKKLNERGFEVKFIKNPVIHIGLESSEEYLMKSKEAIYTMIELIQTKKLNIEDVKLSSKANRIHPIVSRLIVQLDAFLGLEERVSKNLLSSSPSLLLFDLWKLIVYLKAIS